MQHRLGICALLGILALCGCAVGPDFHAPNAQVPGQWAVAAPGERPAGAAPVSSAVARDSDLQSWWQSFGDARLDSLIERALAANLDLRAAVLRIEESRTERSATAASWWPSLSANAGYTRTRLSEKTPTGELFTTFDHVQIPGVTGVSVPNPYNQYQLGAEVSWELDVFGRVRRSVEAADAAVSASVEDQRATRVSLLADVARSYLELRGAQASAQSARAAIAITGELLELTQQRRAAGLASEVDVVEAGAELSATQAQLPAYELAVAQSVHSLSRLLGLEPEALHDELSVAAPLPSPPAEVPVGLPSSLARRRPDIRRAEANLHAATAQIGVAVAGLYPQISLLGAGGVQSLAATDLTDWASRFFSLGPTLQLPVFDRGRWQTVTLQRVREKEAAVAYASTVLNALQEVEDALAAYVADQDQQAWLNDTVRQDRDALDLTKQRYASGVASFIEVLDAERTLRQNELSLIHSTLAVDEDLVVIYRALGGGWQQGNATRSRDTG